MIAGSCLLLFVGYALALSPADVTYVEGRAPDDLKAGPDSKSALFGSSASVQTKGFSANLNGDSINNRHQPKYQQQEEGTSSSFQSKGFSANFNSGNNNGNEEQGSSSSIQTKGFSANFNSGGNNNQDQPRYVQRKQQGDVSSTTTSSSVTTSTPTQPRNENFANYGHSSTTNESPRNERVNYGSSTPRSEKVIYYSTAAPKTQRVIYDSTLSSAPRTVKVGYYSSSSPTSSRSQKYTDTYYSTVPPSYGFDYGGNGGVQYSTPQYQPSPAYVSTTNKQIPFINNYQPVYQDAKTERIIPIYEPSQEYNKVLPFNSTQNNFAPRATIQVPYVSQRQEVQAHDQEDNTEDQNQQDIQPTQDIEPERDTQQQDFQSQDDFQSQPEIQPQDQSDYQPQSNYQPQGNEPVNPAVVQKKVNVVTPVVRKTTYEIRKPAIEKQFFDIEERVIVRPAGTVVVELDGPISKQTKGETITDVGKGRIGGFNYPQESSLRPEVSYNGESGYSSAAPSTVASSSVADDGDVNYDDTSAQYVSRRPAQNAKFVSPQMISVGDPDFNKPPYVSDPQQGSQQSQNFADRQNYRTQPTANRNLFFGKQTQYVPVSYNKNGRNYQTNARQVVYSQNAPCHQGRGYVDQQGYVGGNPLYTYVQVQSPEVAFRTYNNRPTPKATLPSPPEEGEVEEIDVNQEEFRNKADKLRSYNQQRQQNSRLTETDNKQIYNDLLNNNNSNTFNISGVNPGERVISATPAPIGSKPASQTFQTRRIVVNHPFETVRVVEEEEQQAKVQEVTVNQRYRAPTQLFKSQAQSSRIVQPVVYRQQYYSGYPSGNYYRSIRK
ncbi:hypothetical protein ACFFRR_011716 [Megaselia abdita]